MTGPGTARFYYPSLGGAAASPGASEKGTSINTVLKKGKMFVLKEKIA
jgi:hypothetical protein